MKCLQRVTPKDVNEALYGETHRCYHVYTSLAALKRTSIPVCAQGQYWIEYLYLLLATLPGSIYTNMAAANCVVITNRGELLEQPISTNSVPRAFFPRVAIGCRLLGGVLIGGYMR